MLAGSVFDRRRVWAIPRHIVERAFTLRHARRWFAVAGVGNPAARQRPRNPQLAELDLVIESFSLNCAHLRPHLAISSAIARNAMLVDSRSASSWVLGRAERGDARHCPATGFPGVSSVSYGHERTPGDGYNCSSLRHRYWPSKNSNHGGDNVPFRPIGSAAATFEAMALRGSDSISRISRPDNRANGRH